MALSQNNKWACLTQVEGRRAIGEWDGVAPPRRNGESWETETRPFVEKRRLVGNGDAAFRGASGAARSTALVRACGKAAKAAAACPRAGRGRRVHVGRISSRLDEQHLFPDAKSMPKMEECRELT